MIDEVNKVLHWVNKLFDNCFNVLTSLSVSQVPLGAVFTITQVHTAHITNHSSLSSCSLVKRKLIDTITLKGKARNGTSAEA
jgi:hypothetical protein